MLNDFQKRFLETVHDTFKKYNVNNLNQKTWEISETECVISIYLPGFEKNEITIKYVNDIFHIEANNKTEGLVKIEISAPENQKIENYKAILKNGVLKLIGKLTERKEKSPINIPII